MKIPRMTVAAVMIGLIVVAIDCAVINSIRTRPLGFANELGLIVLGTLPMANILAIATTVPVRRHARARLIRIGFVVGGLLALLSTTPWLVATLVRIESILESSRFASWFEESPIRKLFAYFGLTMGLPLFAQLIVALVIGWIASRFGGRLQADTAVESPPGRMTFRSAILLIVLVAIPAVVVEAKLRFSVDASLGRLTVGSETLVDLDEDSSFPLVVPAGSPFNQLVRNKVRVDRDTAPCEIELCETDEGDLIRDHRPVQVTVLQGPRSGEATVVPYCFLRRFR